MIDRSEVGMLPISSLNAMEYCPRRFYYQFVQGEMLVNEFVLEGTLEHQRVHQAGSHRTGMEEIANGESTRDRATAGIYPIRIHFLCWLATTGQGTFHGTVASQDARDNR